MLTEPALSEASPCHFHSLSNKSLSCLQSSDTYSASPTRFDQLQCTLRVSKIEVHLLAALPHEHCLASEFQNVIISMTGGSNPNDRLASISELSLEQRWARCGYASDALIW